jgi:hypothetical protein
MRDWVLKFLPGTGRGTMRSMVEGARASMLAALAPLHHRLSAAVPLPVPGRSQT